MVKNRQKYAYGIYERPRTTQHGFIRNVGIFSLLWHCFSIGFLNLKTKQDLKIAQNLSTVSYEDVSNKTIDTEYYLVQYEIPNHVHNTYYIYTLL